MKVMMTGGGTGGHINPAIAIADTIREHHPDAEITFVGTSKGMENRLVPRAGYSLEHIEIQGLRRSLSLSNIKTAYLTLTSVSKAKKLLKKYAPDLVVGTGGYVCYPLCRAAAKLGIPSAVHESNAVPGLAVRMLSPYVDVIFTNFDEAAEHIKPKYRHKIIKVGNPGKRSGTAVTREEAREKLGLANKYRYSVLVYGGSLGADTINHAAADYAKKYLPSHPEIRLSHAAGVANYEEVKQLYGDAASASNLELLDYIYDMPVRQAAADVVICRSGAMTTSELAEAGRAAIFVPSPNVTDDQQYKNAKALADRNAAVLIKDADFNADTMSEAVNGILSDNAYRETLCRNITTFAVPDANERIYAELMKIAEEKNERR
ncbi:MAG: undecaprenyldiphospho-muramoylpentapeptide beta-N-acetylglucosaminyltransferase [Clostridia bacterium]|nr:undecaprenyldiphospho-muramoylpentapeptide beta-N-acetylglucosaminyltransferase [Clostridia bacterium]